MSYKKVLVARCRDLATALLFSGCALLLHLVLRRLLGPLPPFLVFYPAVVLAAMIAGGWAGFFTGLFSVPMAKILFAPTHGTFTITRSASVLAIAVLLFTCIAVVALVSARKRETEVAARARAEADAAVLQLAQTNARLKAVFDSLEEGVLFVDANGAGLTANAAVTRILGVSAAAFSDPATDPRLHALGEDGRPMLLEEMPSARILATGQSVTDVRVNMPDIHGNRHWLKINARPLFAADGTLEGAVTSFSDITARKLADDELKASRDRLELLFENAPMGLAMFDRQMRHLKVSKRFLEDFDLVGQDVIGKFHYDIFPNLPASFRSVHQRALAGEMVTSNADSILRPDGSMGWFRWQIFPWHDTNGSIGGVLLFTEDITAQRRAQMDLELAEERFRKAFLLSPFPVILINWETGIILDANEAQLQMMGRSRHDVLGRCSADFDFWVDPARRDELRRTVLNNGGVKAFRMKFRRGDGEIREGVIDAQEIEIGGQPCVVNITRDVTEELRLEQQAAQVQKTEAIGRLAGGLAHDFNNLLGVITAATELAEGGSPAELGKQLDRIRVAASSATGLTGHLLALSNHDAAFPRELDLNEVLQRITQQFCDATPAACNITFVSERKSALIHADPTLIQRALGMLTTKACGISAGGQVNVRLQAVQFSIETASVIHPTCRPLTYYSISVKDSGPGMTSDQIQSIFEPFAGPRPGTETDGLGYAAVQGIAAQCGGFVDAHSEPRQGSTFTLYLPAVRVASRSATENIAPRPSPVTEDAPRPVVLVVEDNHPLRELTVEMLCAAGFQTLEADSAESAMDLISRDRPRIDLLLTDVIMPGRNGVELHGDLSTTYPSAKVIFMSGYPSDVLQSRASAATEETFLQKPFNRKKLLAKVNAVLKGEHLISPLAGTPRKP